MTVSAVRSVSRIQTDILGPRPRWRPVGVAEMSAPPLQAVAALRVHVATPSRLLQRFTGTGWFASPDAVVTAAHVLDIKQAWVPDALSWHVEIIPALVETSAPFGTFWAVRADRHPKWNDIPASDYDLAVLRLNRPCEGVRPLQPADSSHTATPGLFRIVGYPGTVFGGAVPMSAEGPCGSVEGARIFYDIDVDDGQSGSPVLTRDGSSDRVVALHVGGTGHGGSPIAYALNTGLRLREDLVDWIGQTTR